ncbi:hypothetical protein K449DRAFT_442614 [Hypoxylon sp. EC38]|nr:hypothetical protein K449DRAFT_442614 [Hypoxylon sp. EC38]
MASQSGKYREGLTPSETGRRAAVIQRVQELHPGSAKHYQDILVKAESSIMKLLLRSNKPPFISADFFNWKVDFSVWEFVVGNADSFKWPQPKAYGMPYHRGYLKAFFQAQAQAKEKEKEKEEQKKKSEVVLARVARIMPLGILGSAGSVAAKQYQYHAPLKVRETVHTLLLGRSPYLPHCGPLEIRILYTEDVESLDVLFGQEWSKTHRLASELMGGVHGDIVLYTTCAGSDRLVDGRPLMKCFLDWPRSVDVNDTHWRFQMYHAWVGLLTWYQKQLLGQKQPLMAHLRGYYNSVTVHQHAHVYGAIMNKHQRLEQQDQRQAAAARGLEGGERGHNLDLIRQLDAWGYARCEKLMGMVVDDQKALEDKVRELVRAVVEGTQLRPMPYDRAERKDIARPVSDRLFKKVIEEILDRRGQTVPKRLLVIGKLFTDLLSPWENLLSRGDRYKVAKATLDAWKAGDGRESAQQVDRILDFLGKFKEDWADAVEEEGRK